MSDKNLVLILIILLMILIYRFIKKSIIICPANTIMIIFGKKSGQYGYKTVFGGKAFVIPLFNKVSFLDLRDYSKEIRTKAKDENDKDFKLSLKFTYTVSKEPVVLNNAIERLLGLSDLEIENLASDIIESGIRVKVVTDKITKNDHLKLKNELGEEINRELEKVGLYLLRIDSAFS